MFKKIILSIVILALIGYGIIIVNKENEPLDSYNESIKGENDIQISITHPSGVYFLDEEVISTIEIVNPTIVGKEIWTQLQVENHSKDVIYSKIEKHLIASENNLIQNLKWTIPQELQSGNYKTILTVWDKNPKEKDATIIEQSQSDQGIMYYHKQEDFNVLDSSIWEISNKKLGRTQLKSENVTILDGVLKINMPANKLEGGEISTIEKQGYGAYEIRMKLPSAPSSITGFFMYEVPDFYNEIDIEIYNETKTKLLLTTYADGEVKNEYVGDLDFDPTKEFHNYRFEFYKDGIEFYIDNKFIKGWSEGFTKDRMRLMVNAWYPVWMEGLPTDEEQSLFVDWIRY